jgi:hypothetical protein
MVGEQGFEYCPYFHCPRAGKSTSTSAAGMACRFTPAWKFAEFFIFIIIIIISKNSRNIIIIINSNNDNNNNHHHQTSPFSSIECHGISEP